MKKILFTLLLALVASLTAWADELTETCVIVEFKSGETMAIALSEKPKAQFEQNDLILTSENFESRYATTDIRRFFFEDIAVGIKDVAAERLSEGEIFDTAGRRVASYRGTIDSTTLPEGVYVVKTASGKSFKVTKK